MRLQCMLSTACLCHTWNFTSRQILSSRNRQCTASSHSSIWPAIKYFHDWMSEEEWMGSWLESGERKSLESWYDLLKLVLLTHVCVVLLLFNFIGMLLTTRFLRSLRNFSQSLWENLGIILRRMLRVLFSEISYTKPFHCRLAQKTVNIFECNQQSEHSTFWVAGEKKRRSSNIAQFTYLITRNASRECQWVNFGLSHWATRWIALNFAVTR